MKRPVAWCRLRGVQPAGVAVLLGVALLMSACADEPAPILDPDLVGTMSLAPASATPGQEVAMRFPADSQRGIAISLSQWSESQWKQTYYLTSDLGHVGRLHADMVDGRRQRKPRLGTGLSQRPWT